MDLDDRSNDRRYQLLQRGMPRRRFVGGLMAGSAAALLVACSNEASQSSASTTSPDGDDAREGTTSSTAASNPESSVPDSGGWLVGGTDLISVDFPDDSLFDEADLCSVALSTATGRGPCYFAIDTGEDISEGLIGLPMQLCLQVVDANCDPVEGLTVEVWHSDIAGNYSGDSSASSNDDDFATELCTNGNEEATNSTWFRGQLTTNASGRVNFKTCFPGWYPGRSWHVHLAISDSSGSRLVSQLGIADGFATEIFTTHELYRDRGDQDTPLQDGSDVVFDSSESESLLRAQQNTDGSLLAYAAIQIS